MSTVRVKIIQPTRIVLDDECEHIVIPGSAGDFGVSSEHTPLITTIRPGALVTYTDGKQDSFAIHDGFVTVENNVVRIVCEVIEKNDEVDKKRAEKAKRRAEDRLNQPDNPDIDYRRAEAALARAVARLRAVSGN